MGEGGRYDLLGNFRDHHSSEGENINEEHGRRKRRENRKREEDRLLVVETEEAVVLPHRDAEDCFALLVITYFTFSRDFFGACAFYGIKEEGDKVSVVR
ncbi:hypothetical protein E2N92_05395 [Methanofollis formosanus]|uniref:Uncharacterized protein n=1 Tax=Methanofollis formosanus TaxID=299308 RepID=A0A8G1EFL7_9EURY|nr:hypothetical protein [Methanofollis formosanus]QYZ78898.1 hypothetical protein E2N92_05395 [Methanofollis formosanus]